MSNDSDNNGDHASHRVRGVTAGNLLEDIDEPAFAGHPTRRRRRDQSILVPLIVMALAVAGVIVAEHTVKPLQALLGVCHVTNAAVVVPQDGVLFGVNLDWKSETLAEHR